MGVARSACAALLASVLAWPTVGLAVEVTTDAGPTDGPAADRVVSDGASLVFVVSGEQRGAVGPCGCDRRPLGGLARQEAFVQALEAGGQPVLVLNAGGWLDASASGVDILQRARVANDQYLRALRRVRVDALNVGWSEFATLDGRGRGGLVSATLHGPQPVLDGTLLEAGGVRVAVTGVTRPGMPYLMPEGTAVTEALGSVAQWAARADADLRVVLVFDDPQAARDLAQVPGVDIVVDAARYNARWAPFTEGAVHVRTWNEATRLTELRVWLSDEGLERVNVREVDLDEGIGEVWRGPPPRL